MKFPCIESTLDIKIGSRIVRLWMNETELRSFYPENSNIVEKIISFCNISMRTDKEIIEYITKETKNCNAIQVKDTDGAVQGGVVVYLVSFSEDNLKG